jgi:hypothetical protein
MAWLTPVNAAVWIWLLMDGLSGYEAIKNQGVPGFPNESQFALYLTFPISMSLLAISILVIYFFFRAKMRGAYLNVLRICLALSIISIIPYLFISRGGI